MQFVATFFQKSTKESGSQTQIRNLDLERRYFRSISSQFTKQWIGQLRASHFNMANARVLVVDDMQQLGDSIAEYLELQGYSVDVATEREEAIALLVHCGYAAVITDLNLTRLQGAEGLDIISHVYQRCPDTRILVITGYSSMDLLEEAKRQGADQILRKPLSLRELARQLTDLGVQAP